MQTRNSQLPLPKLQVPGISRAFVDTKGDALGQAGKQWVASIEIALKKLFFQGSGSCGISCSEGRNPTFTWLQKRQSDQSALSLFFQGKILAWLCPSSPWWSKTQTMLLGEDSTGKEPPEVFHLALPGLLASFPAGKAAKQCQGGYPAKAANSTFHSGLLQNFPAGNKSQQSRAEQGRHSLDEPRAGARGILSPEWVQ